MFSPPPKLGVGDNPWSSENGRRVLALLLNGLLSVELKREVPEEKKPRAIKVVGAQPQTVQPQLQAAE